MGVAVLNVVSRAVFWTAGMFEGMITGMLGSRRAASILPILELDRDPCAELRIALMGRHRRQIVKVLGVPPTASMGFGSTVPHGRPLTYEIASTWYYPFDQRERRAIAIKFIGDRAREVEFIGAPAQV